MISAWKRFINKNESDESGSSNTNGRNGVPKGIQKLDKELQRKFARGVNYNMKIVIKGDAQVGKTALFLRLKGYGFDDNYTPTEHLNVTSIDWNYKTTDDIVKIDLWEAIDSSTRKSINYVDLKMENTLSNHHNQLQQQPNNNNSPATTIPNSQLETKPKTNVTITHTPLSMNGAMINPIPESAKQSLAELSENIDVYKGAHAVLFVMNMTKLWTFKYIQSELPKVPKHIPILIIANHRDQGHHRTVSPEQLRTYIEGLDRTPCDGTVMYTEASMKNGFGLKLIEKFFNIPFLKLQESSYLKQLELNRCEYMSTIEELQIMEESINREYEQYLELQTIRRRQLADAQSPVNLGLRQLDETTREQIRNATISSDDFDKNKSLRSIESNNNFEPSEAQVMASQNFKNDRLPSIVIGAKCPLPEAKVTQISGKPQESENKQQANSGTANQVADKKNQQVVEACDNAEVSDDDSETDEEERPRANPMVANYQSDLDSDDQS